MVDVERFGLAEAVVGRPGIGLGSLFAGRFQPFEIGFEAYTARRARRGVHVADDELRRAFAGDASHPFDVEPGAFEPGRFADVVEVRIEKAEFAPRGAVAQARPHRYAAAAAVPALRHFVRRFAQPVVAVVEEFVSLPEIHDHQMLAGIVLGAEVASHFDVAVFGQLFDEVGDLLAAGFLKADDVRPHVADHADRSLLAGVPREVAFVARRADVADVVGEQFQLRGFAARCGGSRGAEQKRKQQFFHVAGFYACGTAGAAPHAVFIRIPT